MHSGDEFSTRVIRGYSEFTALREPWNHLAAITPLKSVFLRHEWFDAAWQALEHAIHPLILIVERRGEIICICPLALKIPPRRARGRRKLTFFSVPDTQECGLLINPDREQMAIHRIARWLNDESRIWDTLQLQDMPEHTPHRDRLMAALIEHGMRAKRSADSANYIVDVSGNWDRYYGGVSRRVKKNVNLSANRISRSGDFSLAHEDATLDPETSLEDAIRVSARSWKRDLGVTLDATLPGAFIRRLTHLAGELGWLSIWILYVDANPIAMEYQLRYAGRVHALRADFDDNETSASPGLYVHHKQLQTLFDDPETEQYLMGPGANEYKFRWMTDTVPLQGLRAWPPTARGSALYLWDVHLRPWLARLVHFLRRRILRT